MARNRFPKINFTSIKSVFNTTTCNAPIGKSYIGTFLAIYQWGFKFVKISFNVGALFFNSFNPFGAKKRFYFWVDFHKNFYFFFSNRSTRFPFNAARAFAGVKVAHKILFYNIFGNYCFAKLKHAPKIKCLKLPFEEIKNLLTHTSFIPPDNNCLILRLEIKRI